jgi:hypothetical protein
MAGHLQRIGETLEQLQVLHLLRSLHDRVDLGLGLTADGGDLRLAGSRSVVDEHEELPDIPRARGGDYFGLLLEGVRDREVLATSAWH